jgi:4-amino-4-deoxy-L-arabinose transferase-like glycosyltransferase
MAASRVHPYNQPVPDHISAVPSAVTTDAASLSVWQRCVAIWMTVGALLRLYFIVSPREPDDDTLVYLRLGHNLMRRGTYGFAGHDRVSPSLFRLPGYPIFLELMGEHIWLVATVQCVLDLAGCYLLALFLRRYCSEKAALVVLAISTTCLFTASYAGTALMESLSIFAVAAGIYCVGELLAQPAAFSARGCLWRLLPSAAAGMLAMMLRPDGALLTISIAIALLVYGFRHAGIVNASRTACLFLLLACLPLVPWTIRNAVTFHVFQPLAPRHVNDPGERVNLGFYRWLRTWSIDFETTGVVFWRLGSEALDMSDLPPRAYDSDAEKAQTAALFAAYNLKNELDQTLDDRFGALAETRIRAQPLRYYVWVPALRVADMWLRPRTEGIAINPAWWRWREHPSQSAIAFGLALLNLAYVSLAFCGAFRRPPLAVLLATYFGLRCLLLATMENSEPRYTLEAFPILFILGAVFLAKPRSEPQSHSGQVATGS